MNYSEELKRELQILEKIRLKLVKSHSDLLCSFIRDYNVPTDKLMELNSMFFDYGTICSDRTDAFNKEIQERVSKALLTSKTIG
jgi:hypothetical protein